MSLKGHTDFKSLKMFLFWIASYPFKDLRMHQNTYSVLWLGSSDNITINLPLEIQPAEHTVRHFVQSKMLFYKIADFVTKSHSFLKWYLIYANRFCFFRGGLFNSPCMCIPYYSELQGISFVFILPLFQWNLFAMKTRMLDGSTRAQYIGFWNRNIVCHKNVAIA